MIEDPQGHDFLPRMGLSGDLDASARAAFASLRWIRSDWRRGDTLTLRNGISIIGAGWGAYARELSSGEERFVSLLLPGDLCGYAFLTGQNAVATPVALSALTVWTVSIADFLAGGAVRHPVMTAALSSLSVDWNIQQQHLLSIGWLNALERLAHFLCELHYRLGDGEAAAMDVPMSQSQIGLYLSMTSVHVNRTMQVLRGLGLIETHGRRIRICDLRRLEELCGFNAFYLSREPAVPHAAPLSRATAPSSAPLLERLEGQ